MHRRAALAAAFASATGARGAAWRVGVGIHPWRLHPVSFVFVTRQTFVPEYTWGGSHAVEVVVDDDGDGLVNEDGLRTGGPIDQPAMRQAYAEAPFCRYATAAQAEADARGWASGWGWGDDDLDARFNEDPVDGTDNDGDGLIDEDDAAPIRPGRRGSWPTAPAARRWRPSSRAGPSCRATGSARSASTARATWPASPTTAFSPACSASRVRCSSGRRWDPRFGDTGNGQWAEGSLVTAKSIVGNWGFGTELRGLFWIDRVRYQPRPNCPDRTPANFPVYFGADDPSDFRRSALGVERVASRFVIPLQVDRYRPVVKDFRVDPPQRARVVSMGSSVCEGDVWEIAASELFGHGYALDASSFTGRDDAGRRGPPGLYLFRLTARADSGGETRVGTVTVAY